MMIDRDLVITLPRKARREMKVSVVFEGPIPAPVNEGDAVAKLVVSAPEVDTVETAAGRPDNATHLWRMCEPEPAKSII